MSFNGKIKTKSKSPTRNVKKPHPRVEAINVTVEKKKKCNDKALQIVMDFSEGVISEKMLLDNLKFINQEHYQDIVEERAINKLCGYPVCSNVLKNIPSKQYHISTNLNKVFDITDRKNFCSNLCYKASKFLKDQVSTSPLWLREDKSTSFTLICLQSKGGISGDEVDLGVSPVKAQLDDVLTMSSLHLNNHSISKVGDELYTEESEKYPSNENRRYAQEQENETKCQSSENCVSESVSSCKNNYGCVREQESRQESQTESKEKNSVSPICELLANLNDSAVPTEDNGCDLRQYHKKESFSHSNNTKEFKEENDPSGSSTLDYKSQTSSSDSKNNHKHLSKRKSQAKPSVSTNTIQNVVLKIEHILREWISVDSLCYIFGKEKITEILAEKKDQNLPAFTQDVHFYERYLTICKKLNVLELEESKVDASYRDEEKKPLPDYEALKEEARQMEIKVKMFFKGDKVQFEGSKETETKSETADVEPVLPLVDVHAQKALRRRIVVDKLRKVLQDLQKSLGLRGFNLTDQVKTLVGTLTLSAHNITMRPAEWNLVAIAIIKLLSLQDATLAQALSSSIANKHLTLLLMSFSLDAGYLDRLMVWLTDVEAVLQKT